MRPSYLKGGEFQLKVIWESYDGNQTEDIVVSMNDMAPYDFVLDLVSKPEAAINFPYQSIGARMNGAFKRLETSSSRAPEGVVFTIGSRSRPTSILPDAFVVTYASGESETYFSGLRYRGLNTSTVYDLLNSNNLDLDTPGSAYQNFQIAVSQIQGVTATTKDAQQRKSTPKTTDVELEVLKQVDGDDTGYQFDEVINLRSQLSGERMDVAAYKIHDEFAVLKIESFAFEADDDGNPAMISIWSNFTAAAKENGVTKAMIDISGNGGGVITSGYQLAVSLFPFAPYKVFERQFDVTYNSVMLAYNDTVSPVMDSLKLEVNLLTDTQLEAYIEASPTSTGELVSSMIESLLGFCCNDILLETCQNLQRCFPLFDLSVSAQTMNQFPSAPQMRSFLQQLTEAFDEYNPFNVLQTLQRGFVDPNKIHKVVRGGQVVNLTNQFTILEEQLYYEAAAQAFQNDFFFDEVVIVSDGAAGSTACIFSSMVMQLWKNRDAWEGREVPITTITYGGTKEPSDTTVAGFPASVQQVNIGYPIITSGLLYMLEFLLPPALSVLLTNVNSYYQSLLPVPPYFAESLPQMPVFNYYSNFMQPGAIPLQFVKIVADKHLPQIFNHNSLASTSGLETLYEEAAKLGFTTDTVVEESEDETHDVVAERKRFEPGGRQ
ncbi:expressed unknown protein [Seminavis robusta]|uniref:Tail specific protease domain-containing protein n=1 Tax=Seminavis robusta TaxID=568900 RepID=A0A9N8DP03_9STRA|nr:expressed unknown protein [Seminavis robusta]|eukprot:Sro161_g072490.1 n/a (661) ;mRNA; f:48187-50261